MSVPEDQIPAGGEAPAQPDSRDALLEQRLARMEGMTSQVSDFIAKQERQDQASQVYGQLRTQREQADRAVFEARQALSRAMEEADTEAQLVATEALAEAKAEQKAVAIQHRQIVEGMEREQREAAQAPAQPAGPDTTNLNSWKALNPWYGQDEARTAVAREIDKQIRAEMQDGTLNVAVGSPAYFREIDERLRARDAQAGGRETPHWRRGSAPPLASSQSQLGGGSAPLRMDPLAQEAAAAMGLTPEQWREGREAAVQAGHLPADPYRGSRVLVP